MALKRRIRICRRSLPFYIYCIMANINRLKMRTLYEISLKAAMGSTARWSRLYLKWISHE